jgi:DNA-3-methyladenine glycosylase II
MRTTLAAPPGFDLALSARVLRRSPRNPVDRVSEDGVWARVVPTPAGPAELTVSQRGARLYLEAAGPLGRSRGHGVEKTDAAALRALVARTFSFRAEIGGFWRMASADRAFAPVAARCAGLRPQRFPTLFEALANGICCQQLSLHAGLSRLGRLADRFGPRPSPSDDARPGAEIPVGPPDPARVAEAPLAILAGAGLSAARAAQLRALARLPLAALEAELAALDDAAARARLLDLPGVGPWTADYVLLRGLGRLDVFPAGDVGAARALGAIVGRALDPAGAARLASRFAPLRGMVYFCLLGSALAQRLDSQRLDSH